MSAPLAAPDAPAPAPYPVQRGLSAPMREAAGRAGDVHRMQAWAGQAAALARPEPAGEVVRRLWEEAEALLPAMSRHDGRIVANAPVGRF